MIQGQQEVARHRVRRVWAEKAMRVTGWEGKHHLKTQRTLSRPLVVAEMGPAGFVV